MIYGLFHCIWLSDAIVSSAGSYLFLPFSREIKTPLTEQLLCQGRIKTYPRCHLVFTALGRALCGIPVYPRQLTYAPTSQATKHRAFHSALRGPFDNLFPIRIPASRTLCGGITAVISASTVFIRFSVLYAKGIQMSTRKRQTLRFFVDFSSEGLVLYR